MLLFLKRTSGQGEGRNRGMAPAPPSPPLYLRKGLWAYSPGWNIPATGQTEEQMRVRKNF